jgi:hypothetical protein
MHHAEERRMRLAQLLDLAQTYRGWTRKELASALRRDPTKLIPGSGVPKMDYVVELAATLDWSVSAVVAHLSLDPARHGAVVEASGFGEIDAAARDAHRAGDYQRMVELGRKAFDAATSPEQRARACQREAGGWDGMGRYTNELKALRRGLAQSPVSPEFRRMLQANLANAYYSVWSLVEAKAIALELIMHFRDHAPQTLRDRKTVAFAHYVAGHTSRRLIASEPDRAAELAAVAKGDLVVAKDLLERLSAEVGDASFAGIGNTCRGGIIETEVALGERTVESALDELAAGLEVVATAEPRLAGDWLESYGWWCIFGCNLALRHLTDERLVQTHMAIFTNKADEIASELNNWAIRERVFTMEHSRWERAIGCTGFDIPRVIDEEEVRIITGTMARFPAFRDTGWRILSSARVVRDQ